MYRPSKPNRRIPGTRSIDVTARAVPPRLSRQAPPRSADEWQRNANAMANSRRAQESSPLRTAQQLRPHQSADPYPPAPAPAPAQQRHPQRRYAPGRPSSLCRRPADTKNATVPLEVAPQSPFYDHTPRHRPWYPVSPRPRTRPCPAATPPTSVRPRAT